MTKVIRGTRKGIFTFKESAFGPDVLMPYEHWRDHQAWAEKMYQTIVMVHTHLTPPYDNQAVMAAYRMSGEAMGRHPTEDGFQERRGE